MQEPPPHSEVGLQPYPIRRLRHQNPANVDMTTLESARGCARVAVGQGCSLPRLERGGGMGRRRGRVEADQTQAGSGLATAPSAKSTSWD